MVDASTLCDRLETVRESVAQYRRDHPLERTHIEVAELNLSILIAAEVLTRTLRSLEDSLETIGSEIALSGPGAASHIG